MHFFLTIFFLLVVFALSQEINDLEYVWDMFQFENGYAPMSDFFEIFWYRGQEDFFFSKQERFVAKQMGIDQDQDGFVSKQEFLSYYGGPYEGMLPVKPYDPVEVHINIALSAEDGQPVPDTLNVIFVTREPLEDPFLEVSEEGGAVQKVSAQWSTYEVPKKWWRSFYGNIYTAHLPVSPDTKYAYSVGGTVPDTEVESRSQMFSFTSPPQAGSDKPIKTVVFGDQGTFMPLGFAIPEKVMALEQQGELDFDFTFLVGDMSYAGIDTSMPRLDVTKEDEFELVWDLFYMQNEPMASTRPFLTAVGNHDVFYDAQAYRYRLWEGQEAFWYSYNYGKAHWISASSEHDISADSEQYKFLEEDLKNVDRSVTPWVIFNIHRPVYCSSTSAAGDDAKFQAALESLFLTYHVDVVITGHVHCYERVHPVQNGDEVTQYPAKNEDGVDVYTNPSSPLYLVIGSAGAFQAEKWTSPQPDWSAVRYANGMDGGESAKQPTFQELVDMDEQGILPDDYHYANSFGFGVLDVYNNTHLEFNFVPVQGDLTDSFWIVKSSP
jgi:hypothetical protein